MGSRTRFLIDQFLLKVLGFFCYYTTIIILGNIYLSRQDPRLEYFVIKRVKSLKRTLKSVLRPNHD